MLSRESDVKGNIKKHIIIYSNYIVYNVYYTCYVLPLNSFRTLSTLSVTNVLSTYDHHQLL